MTGLITALKQHFFLRKSDLLFMDFSSFMVCFTGLDYVAENIFLVSWGKVEGMLWKKLVERKMLIGVG